jgi:hypothetical protein
MEMGYRDHIVAKLSALAVAGGTTAMLFAASPVHTQFSATRKGSLSASGAKVALRLHNGYLNATNLLPAVTTVSGTGATATTTTTYYPTNSQTVTLQNTGSVPETFTMIISKYACGSLATLPPGDVANALDQLQVNYTVDTINGKTPSSPLTGTVAPFARSGLTTLTCSTSTSTTNPYTSVGSNPITIDLGTINPSKFSRVTLSVQLAAASGVNANDWNGATGVEIPYTIQAEPDDAAATLGTSTGPTLSSSSTSAPTSSSTSSSGSQNAVG